MQLSRLQLALIIVTLVIAGYCGFVWWESHRTAPAVVEKPLSTSHSLPKTPAPTLLSPTLLPTPAPSASAPMTAPGSSYTVVKGDTLWHIAVERSPVHQGPGWVAIWQANKSAIKDFDHLEVGTNLAIPETAQAYVMRYWKPRSLARLASPVGVALVDLRQLPPGAGSLQVDLAQLPASAEFALVDLQQLPGAETAVAALPSSLRVDLNELPAPPEMALAALAPDSFTVSAFRWPVEHSFGQPRYR